MPQMLAKLVHPHPREHRPQQHTATETWKALEDLISSVLLTEHTQRLLRRVQAVQVHFDQHDIEGILPMYRHLSLHPDGMVLGHVQQGGWRNGVVDRFHAQRHMLASAVVESATQPQKQNVSAEGAAGRPLGTWVFRALDVTGNEAVADLACRATAADRKDSEEGSSERPSTGTGEAVASARRGSVGLGLRWSCSHRDPADHAAAQLGKEFFVPNEAGGLNVARADVLISDDAKVQEPQMDQSKRTSGDRIEASAPKKDMEAAVGRFLIAATAKDLSIMVALRRSSDGAFVFRVAATDLDPKPAAKIPHYHKLDQKIVESYLEVAELK